MPSMSTDEKLSVNSLDDADNAIDVTFASSDPAVATIEPTAGHAAYVIGQAPGTTTVSASAPGWAFDPLVVTVTEPPQHGRIVAVGAPVPK